MSALLSVTRNGLRLTINFETIEVDFEMTDVEIILLPAGITSMNVNIGEDILVATNVMYGSVTDNRNHY